MNDKWFPKGSTTIRFQGNVNKFYVTSRKEKKNLFTKKWEAQTTSLYIWRGEFEIEYLLKNVLTLKFNIYENKHISIQLPEL